MRIPVMLAALVLHFPVRARGDDFWQQWGDGKAELDSYALVEPRYGAPRDGTVVLVFVTEDFSDSLRVKADPGRHPSSDVYPVLKLNAIRDFQTGIYDYNVMTSTFARTEWGGGPPFPVVKTSFSSQEWCGHVYQQWLIRDARMHGAGHSYFDDEADATGELPFPSGGVVEEAVPILIRGLRGDWLAPGESRTLPFVPSAVRARLSHRRQAWGEATIRRGAEATTVTTVLGKIRAIAWTVAERLADGSPGVTVTWSVEEAPPHRILGWQSDDGESARLLGSARLAYWRLNGPGGERSLAQLGLSPHRRRAPAPEPRAVRR